MEIKDCSCGRDHETMPMIDVSGCFCALAPDPNCDHKVTIIEGVCREHKRHVPCRSCMAVAPDLLPDH